MKIILNAISKISCLFLSIILFFLLSFYLCLDLIPKIITKDNVKVIINEIKTEELLSPKEDGILNNLYSIARDNNMDVNLINDVINSVEFKELISNYYGELVEALLYDYAPPKLDSDSIISAIDQNIVKASKKYGYEISVQEKNIIMAQIKEKIEKTNDSISDYEQFVVEIGQDNIEVIRFLFGDTIKTILIIIIILIVLLMGLINWSIYRFAIWSGIVTVIVGIMFMLLGPFVYDSLLTTYPNSLSLALKSLIENNIIKTISNIGTTTLVVGLGQLVYHYIMKQNHNSTKY